MAQGCIRCYFGGSKGATDQIKVGYGSSEYALDLCNKHAAEFDDMMWGWLRIGRLIDDDNFANGVASLSETARLAPRIEHTPSEPPVESGTIARAPSKTEMDVIRLRWIISNHAEDRLAERGPLFGFGVDDVLRAAELPERSHRDRTRDTDGDDWEDVWVHWRGNVKVVVNRTKRIVLTCGGRDVVAHAI